MMLYYKVDSAKSQKIWSTIDNIYHSETWQDMWIKIDLSGLDVDLDAFMMLCSTLCYHYGFWVHTKPRFLAFKKFLKLKRFNPLTEVKLQEKTLEAVKREIVAIDTAIYLDPTQRTPGRRAEFGAWRSIQLILEHCQDDAKKSKSRKKKR